MKEAEVELHLVLHVEKLGGKAYKFESPSHRGVSDRIVCLPDGTTWFIELKRPKGGRLSPLQAIFRGEMLMLNQKYSVLWTKEQVDAWVKAVSK